MMTSLMMMTKYKNENELVSIKAGQQVLPF